jgi:hypothetical protein
LHVELLLAFGLCVAVLEFEVLGQRCSTLDLLLGCWTTLKPLRRGILEDP